MDYMKIMKVQTVSFHMTSPTERHASVNVGEKSKTNEKGLQRISCSHFSQGLDKI